MLQAVSHPFLLALEKGVLLCDGAMGTLLHERGVPLSACLEAVNLENPDLVAAIHRRLCIPNWFQREHLEDMTGESVSEKEWKGFCDWLDKWVADEMSRQFRDWWDDFRQYKEEEEGDER